MGSPTLFDLEQPEPQDPLESLVQARSLALDTSSATQPCMRTPPPGQQVQGSGMYASPVKEE